MRSSTSKTAPLLALALLGAAPAWAADHHVTVGGQTQGGGYYGGDSPTLMFTPSSLTIEAGDRVIFANAGGVHDVVADDGSFRCARGCDGRGGDGDPSGAAWSATVTFDTPGTFGFHCEVHGSMGMVGTITVESPPPPPPAALDLDQHGLTGSWADADADSQGVLMQVYPDLYGRGLGLLFGGWFTYDVTAAGGQRWYTIQGQVGGAGAGATATLPVYATEGGAFDSSQPTATAAIGEATLHFDDCLHATMDYRLDDGGGRGGRIALNRLLQNVDCAEPGAAAAAAGRGLLSGAWAGAGSGQGFVLDVNPAQNVLFAAWYTFLPDAAADAGAAAQHWYTLQASTDPDFTSIGDIRIYDSTGGAFDQHAAVSTDPVGTASLAFADCNTATLTYAFTAGANAGAAGTLDLARIGPAPAGCSL